MEKGAIFEEKSNQILVDINEVNIDSFEKPPIIASGDYYLDSIAQKEFQLIHPSSNEGKQLKDKIPKVTDLLSTTKNSNQDLSDYYKTKEEPLAITNSLETLDLLKEGENSIKFEYKKQRQEEQSIYSNISQNTQRVYDLRASTLEQSASKYLFNNSYGGGLETTLGNVPYKRKAFWGPDREVEGYYAGNRRVY